MFYKSWFKRFVLAKNGHLKDTSIRTLRGHPCDLKELGYHILKISSEHLIISRYINWLNIYLLYINIYSQSFNGAMASEWAFDRMLFPSSRVASMCSRRREKSLARSSWLRFDFYSLTNVCPTDDQIKIIFKCYFFSMEVLEIADPVCYTKFDLDQCSAQK